MYVVEVESYSDSETNIRDVDNEDVCDTNFSNSVDVTTTSILQIFSSLLEICILN